MSCLRDNEDEEAAATAAATPPPGGKPPPDARGGTLMGSSSPGVLASEVSDRIPAPETDFSLSCYSLEST